MDVRLGVVETGKRNCSVERRDAQLSKWRNNIGKILVERRVARFSVQE